VNNVAKNNSTVSISYIRSMLRPFGSEIESHFRFSSRIAFMHGSIETDAAQLAGSIELSASRETQIFRAAQICHARLQARAGHFRFAAPIRSKK
jgi:hypothetical protein